jgi:hypothetical protein
VLREYLNLKVVIYPYFDLSKFTYSAFEVFIVKSKSPARPSACEASFIQLDWISEGCFAPGLNDGGMDHRLVFPDAHAPGLNDGDMDHRLVLKVLPYHTTRKFLYYNRSCAG